MLRAWKLLGLGMLLVIGSLTVSSIGIGQAMMTVCSSGCDYTSIQAAITAAPDGSTIQVQAGTYNEHVTILNKTLSLIGDGSNNTIIQGNITILAAKVVSVTGFAVQGQGIQLLASTVISLSNNVVASSISDGISILNSASVAARGNVIRGNRGSGVVVTFGSSVSLDNNSITGNGGDGISVGASQVDLRDNVIVNNDGCGVRVDTASQLSGNGNHGGFTAVKRVPEDFTTIQAAIDAVPSGLPLPSGGNPNGGGDACGSVPAGLIGGTEANNFISIAPGTYKESLRIQDKALALQGAGRDQTFLDGDGLTDIDGINIAGSAKVTIADLTIRNFNVVATDDDGIYIRDQARLHILDSTITRNSGHGIHAESADNIEECLGNIVTDNGLGNFAGSSDEVAREVAQKCGY